MSSVESTLPQSPTHRSWWRDLLHLFGLSALVVAQPLLDRLQHNPGYITQEGLGASELYSIAATLLIGIPLTLLLMELIARLAGVRVRTAVHFLLIATLLAVILIALLTRAADAIEVRKWGLPTSLVALLAIPVTWRLMRNYQRGGWVSSLLTFSSLGLVIFPATFFLSKHISAICFPTPPAQTPPRAGNPVPVVMVVFDGFSGMSLLNEQHQIDAVRYPNFARLAQYSTYYRNASTVHYRTDSAVPAILSGRIPTGDQPPFIAEYPVNLFTLLHNSGQYEMTVFEPFTRLCPSELRYLPPDRTPWDRLVKSLKTLGTVYLETTFPHDLPFDWPDIPREWFRMPQEEQIGADVRTGLVIYGWDTDRHDQVEHFVQCLLPASRPALRFLHVVLPHYPYIYLPSGNRCVHESTYLEFPLGAHGTLGEDWGPDDLGTHSAWQRYLLQAQYTDRCLGEILDRLEQQQLLDDALLIVTADHGVAFKTNHSRRDPVPETLPHILPVPLFIKLPGKQAGDVTDRNVECIDLLPTIANIIDIDLPGPVDGASILDPRETPRPRKTLVLPRGQLAIDPDFPERFSYVDEMVRLFGSGTGDDRLLDFDLHPEWIGKPRQEFPLGPKSPISIQLEWGGDYVSPSQSDIIPCFFKGWAIAPEETALSLTIAVEVNGEIAGVTRTFNDPEAADRWCTMTDERRFHVGHNDVHIYEVREVDGKYQFCPCDVPELAGSRRRSSPQSDTREPD